MEWRFRRLLPWLSTWRYKCTVYQLQVFDLPECRDPNWIRNTLQRRVVDQRDLGAKSLA